MFRVLLDVAVKPFFKQFNPDHDLLFRNYQNIPKGLNKNFYEASNNQDVFSNTFLAEF